MTIAFRISDPTMVELNKHLFPGDGKEAVAFILCGHIKRDTKTTLLAHKVIPLSYDSCVIREYDYVQWLTDELVPILNQAEKENLAVVKVHCHPQGYDKFSDTDNESDKELFPSIYDWSNNGLPGLSAILLPDNKLIVRHVTDAGLFVPVAVTVIGDEIHHSPADSFHPRILHDFEERNLQVFGKKTRDRLSSMKIAIIGASGTGSPTIEQLNRLGTGELVIIDPDIVEHKNLNRITNTKAIDAVNKEFKVHAIKGSLEEIGLKTVIKALPKSIFDIGVIEELATCDFMFGCVDSAEARCLLNRISNFYLIPYIDIGICLDADGAGGVTHVSGKIGYYQPGRSDHLSRRSVLSSSLEAEALKRTSPEVYQDRLNEGYIKGVVENSPAIIPVNTYASSTAVMEFLARIHDYRNEPNNQFAQQEFCLVNNFFQNKKETEFKVNIGVLKTLGRGDINLILGMPEFSKMEQAS